MIDLHCHILPGVDDGSASLSESCMMAQMAVESGITAIAVTPHYNIPGGLGEGSLAFLEEQRLELARELERQNIPLTLYAGMEVFVTSRTPRLVRKNQIHTLGGSRYLLVEFGFNESSRFIQRMLEDITQAGCVPVVAHPERYYCVQDDWDCLRRWTEQGWLLQVNKGSFFGMFGQAASRTAHWCLDEGCVHLIGSDAHSPYRRTTRLSDVWGYVAEYDCPETADLLLRDNPARVLADETVPPLLAQF
ncbi:hypothetical protein H7U37_05505 [Pseudoflavonifractor phocaeensis]|uniref:tyrosine-protein phosphatase n=1 Tax=Pseudoflavonifractor phocaeensis TaxID=1870988 RepID=UPI00195B6DB9|nr:CpsB/CapC family capsule biosynthesis tyrosine phosphatase [Pseudoflavonifractor phocaeensis]MBM6870282.1 hypothetical protein [Pseudoflavonifractor phocaeensis]MBM6937990.1 hypothetical protein [Pseudoflavonifractor phocaeensis]